MTEHIKSLKLEDELKIRQIRYFFILKNVLYKAFFVYVYDQNRKYVTAVSE